MRLLFDHGTLLLAEAPDLCFDFVPGLVWERAEPRWLPGGEDDACSPSRARKPRP